MGQGKYRMDLKRLNAYLYRQHQYTVLYIITCRFRSQFLRQLTQINFQKLISYFQETSKDR